VLDLDDKDFFVIANEDRAATVRGEDAANVHRDNVVLHAESLCAKEEKTSPVCESVETLNR
jgi:hypothetical protein